MSSQSRNDTVNVAIVDSFIVRPHTQWEGCIFIASIRYDFFSSYTPFGLVHYHHTVFLVFSELPKCAANSGYLHWLFSGSPLA